MKWRFFYYALLSLFMLSPASITRAQTITSQKGLTTAVFPTQHGNVKVYLPDDIRAGDMISGTVIAEPNGNNSRQIDKSLVELKKYTIRFNNEKFPVGNEDGRFSFIAHTDRQFLQAIEMRHVSGQNIFSLPVPSIPAAKKDSVPKGGSGGADPRDYVIWQNSANEGQNEVNRCITPTHALTAAPMQIMGPFDGNASNTQCSLNNQPVQVLAESPGQCQVQYPANGQGVQTMQINENGQQLCSKQISGVDMVVTTGDLDLRKGQNTFIDVKLLHLERLPDKATLTITNTTPNVVTMTNGNVQVIPIWPPPDSANGTFSIHCPAVSTATGNFTVTINLDLPQPGDVTTPQSECPPGYIKKSCNCGASVKVSKSGNSLTATAKSECTGVWGVGINTFPVCAVLKTEYSWSIKDGKENVELVGKTDGKTINIRPKNNRGFTVCVKVTVTCIDGTVCTAEDCVTQSGETVPPPPSSRCNCSATCAVTETARNGNVITYSGAVKAACTGTFGTGNTRSVCGVAKVTYNWTVSTSPEDKGKIEIDGKADGASVNVKIKGECSYSVSLSGTVECNDGTTCDFYCNAEIPYIPTTNERICLPDVEEKMGPKMVGGLKSKQAGTGSTSTIFRDDFIALEAAGSDVDLVVFKCNPKAPCPDTRSEKTIEVKGKVRFEWTITAGEGRFVKLGCAAENEKTNEGEHVVFQPPYVALPVKSADTFAITTVLLSIIDDGSPVTDLTVTKTITIKTTRKKSLPDKYEITITGGEPDKPAAAALPVVDGSCKLVGPSWKPGDNLAEPAIMLPGVADADKMVLGQWMVLKSQDQNDPDDITYNCTSANCTSSGGSKTYPDNIMWEWTIVSGGGKFILGNGGQYVIYEAPMEMPKGKEVIEVKMRLKVMNPAGPRKDPDKISKEFVLKIYQPGVKLSHPDFVWLPTDNNSLELKSELMYKVGGKWLPALSHMCRIHYFELMNVSMEKGVCLNTPVPKDADQCRDLQLKQEAGHEAWDDTKASNTKCDTKGLYQQARTEQPEKEYSIKIYSRDFGSYGFLRSFANVNKKTSLDGKPVYISIPVTKDDVKHPTGRIKKTVYPDNRVTIPIDIDENRIADGGWMVTGGGEVPDPANNNEDEDDKPAGDGFNGDGLSTYEEYRGFMVMDGDDIAHTRTSYKKKDIFVKNESGLDLAVYQKVSGLQVHEINDKQYVDDNLRVVNKNFNPTTHIVDQRGLRLVDRKESGSLLGIAESETGQPTVPNREIEIKVFSKKIAQVCKDKKIDFASKMAAVVAHELLHGNNVCHHGEQNPAVENSFNLEHGLRSGNVSCVMRYDNVGGVVPGYDPEAIGSDLCTSPAGTGYNANGKAFKDAAPKRGNCKGQIRVSGKGATPKTCGNR
ncbi:MAG: hypothetical protein HZB42_07320 [Sphingobacteriales bacterium]|nr:hypothetical protein [Sphingobacteriales bacterium]